MLYSESLLSFLVWRDVNGCCHVYIGIFGCECISVRICGYLQVWLCLSLSLYLSLCECALCVSLSLSLCVWVCTMCLSFSLALSISLCLCVYACAFSCTHTFWSFANDVLSPGLRRYVCVHKAALLSVCFCVFVCVGGVYIGVCGVCVSELCFHMTFSSISLQYSTSSYLCECDLCGFVRTCVCFYKPFLTGSN